MAGLHHNFKMSRMRCGHPVLVAPYDVGVTGLFVILDVLLGPLFTEYKFVNCILFGFG